MANWEARLQVELDKKLAEVQNANNNRYIGHNASSRACSSFTLSTFYAALAVKPSVSTHFGQSFIREWELDGSR